MSNFNNLLPQFLVYDLGRTQNSVDAALKKFSPFAADILEACEDEAASSTAAQLALEHLAEGFKAIVDGRRALVDARLELLDIEQGKRAPLGGNQVLPEHML